MSESTTGVSPVHQFHLPRGDPRTSPAAFCRRPRFSFSCAIFYPPGGIWRDLGPQISTRAHHGYQCATHSKFEGDQARGTAQDSGQRREQQMMVQQLQVPLLVAAAAALAAVTVSLPVSAARRQGRGPPSPPRSGASLPARAHCLQQKTLGLEEPAATSSNSGFNCCSSC